MTQATEFTYTFDAITTPRPAQKSAAKSAAEAELFAVEPLAEQMLPDGNILARNRSNGRQLVLPVDIFDALGYCHAFRTIQGHTEHLVKENPASAGREADVHTVLKLVQSGGLTISARDVCQRLAPPASIQPVDMKPVVAVLTWERPEALKRLLASMLENVDLSALDCCFIVDDSGTQANIEANQRITRDFARRSDLNIHYFGAAQAREFVNQLINALPQQESVIRFLADREHWTEHFAVGVSRNISQLLSVGKPLIMLDDDVLCQLYDAPVLHNGIEFSVGQREAVFYRDRADWPEPGRPNSASDPIKAHMQCLGLTVPEAVAALGEKQLAQQSLAQAPPIFAAALNAQSRVLVTQCGSLGDPGTGNNHWLATLSTESRDRLLQTEGLLEHALQQRNCWLGRSRPVFQPRANMSQISGLDNRVSLPPYFPNGRGEDRLFGYTVGHIFYDSVALDYPWATPHLPLPERQWTEADNNFSKPLVFPDQLSEFIIRQNTRCLARAPEDRRAVLATAFKDLAGSSRAALMDQYAEMWNGDVVNRLRLIQTSLGNAAGTSPTWQAYLQNARQQAQLKDISDFHALQFDADSTQTRGEVMEQFWRKSWRKFGEGLLAWPEIRAAAADICSS